MFKYPYDFSRVDTSGLENEFSPDRANDIINRCIEYLNDTKEINYLYTPFKNKVVIVIRHDNDCQCSGYEVFVAENCLHSYKDNN